MLKRNRLVHLQGWAPQGRMQLLKLAKEHILHAELLGNVFSCRQDMRPHVVNIICGKLPFSSMHQGSSIRCTLSL